MERVLPFAPRIPPALLEAIMRLDDPTIPIAEVCRRVGRAAWRLGLPRPSYQRVRELVHASRRLRRLSAQRRPSTLRVLWEINMRVRPPRSLLDLLYGGNVAPLPP